MKNLIVRACTGFIYVLLLIGCTIYSPISAYFFYALVTAATLAEFCSILHAQNIASPSHLINGMAGYLLVSASWLYCCGGRGADKIIALYGVMLLYILVSELYRKADNPLLNWGLSFAAQIYVAVPFALLPMLSISYESGKPVYQCIYIIALFVFLWCNDTGAYLTGCTLSRYFPAKLFPRISPKKSWVGSIGGGLLTIAAAVLTWHFCPVMPLWRWMGFALTIIVFGTWGDLVESLFKRQLGIKDSGSILPGHGGLLDRFDSSLLAIPAVFVYMILTT